MKLREEKMETLIESIVYNAAMSAFDGIQSRSSRARVSFQWGGTIFALLLLILNQCGRRSSMQTTLLVAYLFLSVPTVFFKILRGQFGYWVSFLAVLANLFFPERVPVSRIILFVASPEWLADELRDSIAGAICCLLLGIAFLVIEIRAFEGFGNLRCNFRFFCYCTSTAFLFFFALLYICLGA